jgi:uncharacterized protein (TIGR02246 family)
MQHVRSFTLLVATATMLSLGFALAQPEDEAAVRQAIQQYAVAYSAGDAPAVAELFTEDAVFVTPDGVAIEGRPTLRSMFQEHFAAGALQLTIDDVDTVVIGDVAYSMTRWSGATDEGEVVVGGYGLVILAQVDGAWKWHRHVANMILPDPEGNGSD